MKRPAVLARRDLLVRLLRLLHREIVGERDNEVQHRVIAFEAIEVHARELDAGHLMRLEQMREVRHRPEGDVFEVRGTAHRWRRARAKRLCRPIEARAGHQRAVVQRRRDVRIDVDLAQVRITREVLVGAAQQLLALFLGEVEPRDGQRIFQHRRGDAPGPFFLKLCPEHAGQQRRRQADSRKIGDEPSSGGGGCRHTSGNVTTLES